MREQIRKMNEMTELQRARVRSGLTLKAMSEYLEIPKRTIEAWEQGTRKCPPYVERLVIRELDRYREENYGKEVEEENE